MNIKLSLLIIVLLNYGCNGDNLGIDKEYAPLETVDYVDIERFMGDWYVIANIPTFIEKRATNAIESYKLNDKGEVETTFTFYEDSPRGKKRNTLQKDSFIIQKQMQSGECSFCGRLKCHF